MLEILLGLNTVLLLGILVGLLLQRRNAAEKNEEPDPQMADLQSRVAALSGVLQTLDALLRSESAQSRSELADALQRARMETEQRLSLIQNQLDRRLNGLNELSERRLNAVDQTLKNELRALSELNSQKLDVMRQTVDEKLQQTLNQRFNESFKTIAERLDLVQRGLGEMQHLAMSVGDLQKVLSGVKTRGILGEIQLYALLDQVLSADQYVKNALIDPLARERVEAAVRLPGRNGDAPVLLPIDSKFPMEDYNRLLQAYDQRDEAGIKSGSAALVKAVEFAAAQIQSKYIKPPHSTAFALLFVPTEGLFAELLRQNDLFAHLQRKYSVVIVGPTTLWAVLNSLQIGFKTLAIEQRSTEVWNILGSVKTEFGKFGDVLNKAEKNLETALNGVKQIGTRSRVMSRQLKAVESGPPLLPSRPEDGGDSSDAE